MNSKYSKAELRQIAESLTIKTNIAAAFDRKRFLL